ncbi:MAG: cell division protein FtsA [Pseudomonadota bacterium]
MAAPTLSRDEEVVGVLDIGSSKIACVIVARRRAPRDRAPAEPRALGLGLVRARGVRAGLITSVDEAEIAIRSAIAEAERSAGIKLETVRAGTTAGRLTAERFSASADVATGAVSHDDLRRLHAGAARYAERGGRTPLSLVHESYALDGTPVTGPIFAARGDKLACSFDSVTGDADAIRLVTIAIERSLVSVDALMPSPAASGAAVTTRVEAHDGVIVADFGAETISFAGLSGGRLVTCGAVATGGKHVSLDLARALRTTEADAERVKVLKGTLLAAGGGDLISVPAADAGSGPPKLVPRSEVSAIIAKRLNRQLTLLAEQIAGGPFAKAADVPVVITGGASGIPGLGFIAANILARPVRVVHVPNAGVSGLDADTLPVLSSALGLVAVRPSPSRLPLSGPLAPGGRGYMSRLHDWVQASF